MSVIADFTGGKHEVKVPGLYQYDYGQILEIKGIENLQEDFEVHFSVGTYQSLVMQGKIENQVATVSIPDDVMQQKTDKSKAWIYVEDENSGKSIKTIILLIEPREISSDIPPLTSVTEIKGFADYVKENADKIRDSETAASNASLAAENANTAAEEANKAAEDARELISNANQFLKTYTVSNEEELEKLATDLEKDPLKFSPVAFVLMAGEIEGTFPPGCGLLLIDTDGTFENMLSVPYCYSDYPFTSDYIERLEYLERKHQYKKLLSNYTYPRPLYPVNITPGDTYTKCRVVLQIPNAALNIDSAEIKITRTQNGNNETPIVFSVPLGNDVTQVLINMDFEGSVHQYNWVASCAGKITGQGTEMAIAPDYLLGASLAYVSVSTNAKIIISEGTSIH